MNARVPWSASVTLIAGALFASGCSSGHEARSASEEPRVTDSARVAPPALTAAQLKALAFADGEVPHALKAGVPVEEADPHRKRRFPPVSVPACQTMLDIRAGRRAAAVAVQTFNWKDDLWGGESTLAAYEDGDARQVFAELRQSLDSCDAYEGEGWTGKIKVSVEREHPPRIGDEAVRFHETVAGESGGLGDNMDQVTVVRTGNTIATFTKMNVGARATFPADLIQRQTERLRAAQRS